ncbi:class F sortase [Thermomonospora cellulosilytica]|uniref:Sortase (Surface protein transpeptidase) n=1 Tax=Thermomonospora cellulosilytica TaxID=1411118 RepID=A0A7W3MWQ4_9ACTN|nr:class F sortase [Thermomonospora cellulosilytica]MBA9003310.1 sortase (surface protein transpeptidase) [Thermomonospora cellulosilytica]
MQRRDQRMRVLAAAAVGLAGLGAATFFVLRAFPESPAATAAPRAPGPGASGVHASSTVAPLPRSVPLRLEVPRIGVRTSLMPLGKNADQTVETPPPSRVQEAGWYRLGPAPGSRGAAVIIGHVDSRRGPAVFHRLGELRPGDLASVVRADGRTAVFRIDSVERVGKDRFPTRRVYGDPGYAAIRLVTCGGRFDRASGHYTDNVIAFGHLLRHDAEEAG